MTARARFTQAELARAIAAAERAGKVAIQTPLGIAFVDPATIAQTAPVESEQGGNTCDGKFGARR
jgi:hypothetical protein